MLRGHPFILPVVKSKLVKSSSLVCYLIDESLVMLSCACMTLHSAPVLVCSNSFVIVVYTAIHVHFSDGNTGYLPTSLSSRYNNSNCYNMQQQHQLIRY